MSATDWFLLNPCAEDVYKNLKKNGSGGQEPEATGVTPAVYGGDHKLSGESAPSSSPSALFSAPILCSVGLEHWQQ